MRPVVASKVSETNYIATRKSGVRRSRGCFTMLRSLVSGFSLMASGYLITFTGYALCSDPPTETPAGSTSTAQALAVTKLTKRPVTVADSIQMSRLGDPLYAAGATSKGIVAKFSPDGKHFVVVLKKGNLEANTNEYSLVLFHTAEVFHSPAPRVLVSLSSSSNRPAIGNVRWLDDNDTILFLGEHPGEQTQLYSLKCSSNELKKLTSSATNLTSFAMTADGEKVVYAAKDPVSTFFTESASRNGIAVTYEQLTDLIRGSYGWKEYDDDSLFIQRLGQNAAAKIAIQGRIGVNAPEISLSPNGAHFLLQTEARHIGNTWSEYEDQFLKLSTLRPDPEGGHTSIYQYELVDTLTGTSQVLINTPIPSDIGSEAAWSPDSTSVVVSNVYLPVDVDDPAERSLRKAHTFLVEFMIPSRKFLKISQDDLRLVSWDPKNGDLNCDVGRFDSLTGKTTPKAYFRKSGETWSKATAPEQTGVPPLPEIVLDEGMNTPPHIVAIDPRTRQKSLLMDLNPQFQNLKLARVEEIKWKDAHGIEVKGGLYWPPEYLAGKKYPLILQTHAWDPDRFWMDGPWTTAFCAQALAGKGFFVVQIPDPDRHILLTDKEAPRAMAAYESAIEYLDRRGLIDRDRIGITGFSRTYFYVTYTLTHSTHHFAAADVADGVDYGYFQYMAFSNSDRTLASDFDALNGAPPFGKGLLKWLKVSPSFLMDRIEAPLRIQAIGSWSLLGDWHWFSGLTTLGKPVEMIYMPDGTHILEKPWDRMVSQQGNVDWFCFWLKGEQDPDPAKAEQYSRWRELRKLQDKNKAAGDKSLAPMN